jgi:hypothetical protein
MVLVSYYGRVQIGSVVYVDGAQPLGRRWTRQTDLAHPLSLLGLFDFSGSVPIRVYDPQERVPRVVQLAPGSTWTFQDPKLIASGTGPQAAAWPLLLGAATPLLLHLYRRRRAYHRFKCGLCPSCGYDLHATHQRCPECGEVPCDPPHGKSMQRTATASRGAVE